MRLRDRLRILAVYRGQADIYVHWYYSHGHLVRGVVGPSGIRLHILLMGSWDRMDTKRIYTK